MATKASATKIKRGPTIHVHGDVGVWLSELLAGCAKLREDAIRDAPDPGPVETYAEKRARWRRTDQGTEP